MKIRSFLLLVAALTLGAPMIGCGDPDTGGRPRPRPGEDGGPPVDLSDADGDTIPDLYEDRATDVDTDGDGTPDYLDDDSDGDGVPDSIEGGSPGGEPLDHDFDGTPDFRDEDSDGNGIHDAAEGGGDIDGDGVPNSGDTDDDGDLLLDSQEIGGDSTHPLDSDGDGVQDFQDLDSDDDMIGDRDESVFDTDADGTIDRFDADSDADGLLDSAEAGDSDVRTAPYDSDRDGIADFRDNDADNDGISDTDEATAGSDPYDDDSDDDGVSDLIEVASGTNPLDGADSPRTRGDFVFLEPYEEAPTPDRDTLDFATDIRVADVYFLVDTTGSMGSSIASLRASIADFIPMVRAEIADVWIGVGGFDDYPVGDYGDGSWGDRAYYNEQDLSDSIPAAQAAANRLTTHNGNDIPESNTAALHATITGTVLPGTSGMAGRPAPCPAGRFGYPCFRSGAVPIIVLVTDARAHNGPGGSNAYDDGWIGGHAPTYAETVAALTAANARVIGIGQGTGGQVDLEAFARDTGSVDGAGAPLYSTWSGGAIGATVLNQIRTLASSTRLDISVRFEDDPSDAIDSYASFVDHLEANVAGDPGRGCVARPAIDTNGDGYLDTFQGVRTGERVCFDIVSKQNDTVPPTASPQIFRGTVRVIGDGFTELDSREVFFLVPPRIEPPGGPG